MCPLHLFFVTSYTMLTCSCLLYGKATYYSLCLKIKGQLYLLESENTAQLLVFHQHYIANMKLQNYCSIMQCTPVLCRILQYYCSFMQYTAELLHYYAVTIRYGRNLRLQLAIQDIDVLGQTHSFVWLVQGSKVSGLKVIQPDVDQSSEILFQPRAHSSCWLCRN